MTDTNGAILAKLAQLEDKIDAIMAYVVPSSSWEKHSPHHDPSAMLNEAIALLPGLETISASLIQRRLQVGYARAARILDELESAGYIGSAIGVKPRKVLKRSS